MEVVHSANFRKQKKGLKKSALVLPLGDIWN